MSSAFYFSNLIDRYKGPALLWCILRSPMGRQDFNMSTIASMMNVKSATIRHYLNSNLFFRAWYRLGKDKYRVYLRGLKVIRSLVSNTDDRKSVFGTKFESTNFSLKPVLLEARLATTLQLQRSARKNQIRSNKKKKVNKYIAKHVTFFDENGAPLINRPGVMHYSSKSNSMFLDSTVNVAGVTQKTIASCLNRSIPTIRKSLQHADKVRLFGFKPDYYIHHQEAQFIDSEEGTNNAKAYYKYKNFTFKPFPTVYNHCIDLLGRY